MKIIKHLQRCFQIWKANSAAKMDIKRKLNAEIELNIREFNGELFISYNDIPIVNVNYLDTDMVEVLWSSRESLVAYKKKYQ